MAVGPTCAGSLLDEPLLQPSLLRHHGVQEHCQPGHAIAAPEIPLVGYDGASKTKFSERPIFVDGGVRIVDEGAPTAHDAKLLGARQRRQRQIAERKGGASGAPTVNNFDSVQNFGTAGVVGFLVQSGAMGAGASGPANAPASADGSAGR